MGLTTALIAAGTALNVVGDLSSGGAQMNSLSYQAQIANYNADIAAAEGEARSDRQMLKTAAAVSAIKVAQAANGIDITKGSAPMVQKSARRLGKYDALTIRSDAAREAYGYRSKSKALLDERENINASRWLKATSSLLGGASAMAKIGGKQELTGSGNVVGNPDTSWVHWGM